MVFPARSQLLPYVVLFSLTLVITLGGVLARPIESLSLFWPVNAVLAGVLLRYPRQATPLGFALVWLAMVAADLACGQCTGRRSDDQCWLRDGHSDRRRRRGA